MRDGNFADSALLNGFSDSNSTASSQARPPSIFRESADAVRWRMRSTRRARDGLDVSALVRDREPFQLLAPRRLLWVSARKSLSSALSLSPSVSLPLLALPRSADAAFSADWIVSVRMRFSALEPCLNMPAASSASSGPGVGLVSPPCITPRNRQRIKGAHIHFRIVPIGVHGG